jgi:hypothetical protein
LAQATGSLHGTAALPRLARLILAQPVAAQTNAATSANKQARMAGGSFQELGRARRGG